MQVEKAPAFSGALRVGGTSFYLLENGRIKESENVYLDNENDR